MRGLGWAYGSCGMVMRTLATRLFRTPDYERWTDLDHHDTAWETRTREIAALIPAGAHVVEFGAGRCALRRWLPAGCSYLPSDIVTRDGATWVCDLNRRPLPAFPRATAIQVAVFGGVLEYVVDVRGLLRWLAPAAQRIIASYNCAPRHRSPFARLRTRASRLSAGWLNAFTRDEFIALFEAASFRLVASRAVTGEPDEHIFLFTRE